MKKLLLIICTVLPLAAYSVDTDTITKKIIVLNEGYDRVSAIKTAKGIVIIDTHKSTADMERMRKEIIQYFHDSNFVYIINTHECLEHVNGNSLFPDVPKIAHANFGPRIIARKEERLAQIDSWIGQRKDKISQTDDSTVIQKLQGEIVYIQNMRADYIKAAVHPDISFTDTMTLDMGDLTIQFTHIGKGAHGSSGILIYIPEEKTLFTGSTLALPPVIYKKSVWNSEIEVERWISVIDKFLKEPDSIQIIPSHINYYTRKDLQEMRDYFELIYVISNDYKKSGKTQEDVRKKLDYEMIRNKFQLFTGDEKHRERHYSNLDNLWSFLE